MGSESNRERFVRIAESRTNKILDMLRLLGNCSNTNNYSYTQKDVDQIFGTLEKELKATKAKFVSADAEPGRFSLK